MYNVLYMVGPQKWNTVATVNKIIFGKRDLFRVWQAMPGDKRRQTNKFLLERFLIANNCGAHTDDGGTT